MMEDKSSKINNSNDGVLANLGAPQWEHLNSSIVRTDILANNF